MTDQELEKLGDDIVRILKTIFDPEIPVDIYVEVEEKIKTIEMVNNCEVEITFEPTWTQEMMSEEAKLELGML